jgi:hypothetical protein
MAGIEIGASEGGATVALPSEAAAALDRLDRDVPPPVRRTGERDPATGGRSLALNGVVEVEGGFFLAIPGLQAPRKSSKPTMIMGLGFAVAAVANAAIAAVGASSLLNHGGVTALTLPPFIGWSYRARAAEGALAVPPPGVAVGVLALRDHLVLRYADRAQVIPRDAVSSVYKRKSEAFSRDQAHALYTHELVIGTHDADGLPTEVVPWRLIEHSGSLSTDMTTNVAAMPAIAEYLHTRWLGKPSRQ